MTRGPVLTLVGVLLGGLALWAVLLALQPATGPTSDGAATSPTAVAPTSPEPPTRRVDYVGSVSSPGGVIPVAVTVEAGTAKAYVCDGDDVEAWLQGTTRGDAVEAGGRNGNRMTARQTGDGLEGSVSLRGGPAMGLTARATRDEDAGIYRRVADGEVSGWVVEDRENQTGVTRGPDGALRPATPLPLSDGGVPAGVTKVGATTDVFAQR